MESITHKNQTLRAHVSAAPLKLGDGSSDRTDGETLRAHVSAAPLKLLVIHYPYNGLRVSLRAHVSAAPLKQILVSAAQEKVVLSALT